MTLRSPRALETGPISLTHFHTVPHPAAPAPLAQRGVGVAESAERAGSRIRASSSRSTPLPGCSSTTSGCLAAPSHFRAHVLARPRFVRTSGVALTTEGCSAAGGDVDGRPLGPGPGARGLLGFLWRCPCRLLPLLWNQFGKVRLNSRASFFQHARIASAHARSPEHCPSGWPNT